ncbi:MAG: Re/Si-specific NAD(P)(+) transhydrogenase subunit alpha [Burkholderiaceae bacterium]|nr:Re/Si-specific NAD(P)(+) transhydrogenase subunit alpha [Burkholderiaceae bacterium]
MLIGVPAETTVGETRVAVTPETAKKLVAQGHGILVQSGAGVAASAPDAAYAAVGAQIVDAAAAFGAQLVLKVRSPFDNEVALMQPGTTVVGMLTPFDASGLLRMAAAGLTSFALEAAPRTTRAQSMDVLSSQANIAGYKAVMIAADKYQRFFPMLMTAAGTVKAARVVVLGVGVAGLQAIATAKRLGAVIEASDVRPSVKEQVESLGAKFIDVAYETDEEKEAAAGVGGYARPMPQSWLDRQKAEVAKRVAQADIVITTALIPGRAAPVLVTEEMVRSMKPGSVIVDLAAEQGGNCVLTDPGTVVKHKGVTIIGYTDLPSRMASMSSQLYGACIVALLTDLVGTRTPSSASVESSSPEEPAIPDEGVRAPLLNINLDDEVVRGAIVLHEGKMMWPPPVVAVTSAPPPEPGVPSKSSASRLSEPGAVATGSKHGHDEGTGASPWLLAVVGLIAVGIGIVAPASTLSHFTVFMLACFVGYQVVWNVKPALHTPLMSVTNAISGIILVGGMLQLGGTDMNLTTILGAVAVLIAAINIAGGFLVTNRMLAMFRK